MKNFCSSPLLYAPAAVSSDDDDFWTPLLDFVKLLSVGVSHIGTFFASINRVFNRSYSFFFVSSSLLTASRTTRSFRFECFRSRAWCRRSVVSTLSSSFVQCDDVVLAAGSSGEMVVVIASRLRPSATRVVVEDSAKTNTRPTKALVESDESRSIIVDTLATNRGRKTFDRRRTRGRPPPKRGEDDDDIFDVRPQRAERDIFFALFSRRCRPEDQRKITPLKQRHTHASSSRSDDSSL
jgi:hypothetical protein